MKDIILHVTSIEKFRLEGIKLFDDGSRFFSVVEGRLTYNVDKIPVKYLCDESICLIKGLDSHLDELEFAVKLGECIGEKGSERYEFTSKENRLTYERIRGPIEYNCEIDGKTIKGKHPYMIGVFA